MEKITLEAFSPWTIASPEVLGILKKGGFVKTEEGQFKHVELLVSKPIVNMRAEDAEQECTLQQVVGEDMESDDGTKIGEMQGEQVLVDFNRAKRMNATQILLGEMAGGGRASLKKKRRKPNKRKSKRRKSNKRKSKRRKSKHKTKKRRRS